MQFRAPGRSCNKITKKNKQLSSLIQKHVGLKADRALAAFEPYLEHFYWPLLIPSDNDECTETQHSHYLLPYGSLIFTKTNVYIGVKHI